MVVSKHLASGSECPPFNDKNQLRVYGMRFCPYVQRAKLVLAAKQIPYEEINIDLANPPEWYLKRNPAGEVPGLEWVDPKTQEKHFLAESLVISDYLDDIYPEHHLQPTDPYLKAKQRILIDRFSNVTTTFYRARQDKAAFNDLNENLLTYENALSDKFFGGASPAMIDYMLWPWFERLSLLKEVGYVFNSEKHLPRLAQWIHEMEQLKPVKDVKVPEEITKKFMESYKHGKPQYDVE